MHHVTSRLVGFLAEDGAEGAADSGQSMPLLPHTSELIFGIVVFAILWFFIARYAAPGLEKAYAARHAAIEGGIEKAASVQAEADAVKAQYEAQLADARAEANRIREEAREQGAAILAEMRGQAQTEAARIVAAGQAQIDVERSQAVRHLRGELGRLSTELASRIVGESLHDEARQRRLVERFLADMESGRVTPQVSQRSVGAGQ